MRQKIKRWPNTLNESVRLAERKTVGWIKLLFFAAHCWRGRKKSPSCRWQQSPRTFLQKCFCHYVATLSLLTMNFVSLVTELLCICLASGTETLAWWPQTRPGDALTCKCTLLKLQSAIWQLVALLVLKTGDTWLDRLRLVTILWSRWGWATHLGLDLHFELIRLPVKCCWFWSPQGACRCLQTSLNISSGVIGRLALRIII